MDCYQCYCIDFLLFVDGHCCHRKYCIAALRSLYTFRQLAWLNMNEALYNWDGFHCHCKTAVSSSMSMYGHHYCCSTALLAYTSNRMVHQVNRGNSFQNERKFTQNPVFLFFSNRNKVEEISLIGQHLPVMQWPHFSSWMGKKCIILHKAVIIALTLSGLLSW